MIGSKIIKMTISLMSLFLTFQLFAEEKAQIKANTWIPKYIKESGDSSIKRATSGKIVSFEKTKSGPTKKQSKDASEVSKNPYDGVALKEADILALFKKNYKNKDEIKKFKNIIVAQGKGAIAPLIKVMKDESLTPKNRWLATYFLGRIAGKKSAPFISKFLAHPKWFMRLAALKVLLHLQEKTYSKEYARRLYDDSLIVRTQALENITKLGLREHAPKIWRMLKDKKNYKGKDGQRKRISIVQNIIRAIGDLDYSLVKESLLKMMKSDSYRDLHDSIDYALVKITGTQSPKGNRAVKKHYWHMFAMKNQNI